jgi:hypothetical protein
LIVELELEDAAAEVIVPVNIISVPAALLYKRE